ncbi:MAG: ATP-binding protein [Armatimonadetes bacterium]|nr:ATP-binding protein [Armatimonadota bacterium]
MPDPSPASATNPASPSATNTAQAMASAPDPSVSAAGELTLPPWASEIKRKYESGEAGQFLLHGNVFDLVPFRNSFVWLKDFLIRGLSGGKEMVVTYNLSEGIGFATEPMKEEFKRFVEVLQSLGNLPSGMSNPALYAARPDLIKDPVLALPILEKLIEMRNRLFIVVDHLDKICPPHELAHMSYEDRRNLATLQRWSVHPKLLNRDNVVIMIAKNLGDVHRELRGNPLLDIVEISFPDADERQEFIVNRAEKEGAKLDLSPEQLAIHTAGLTRLGIQSFLRQSRQSGEPITLAMVRRRKDEMFSEEYGGLVEVIEPRFGLEAVGGLEDIKKDLRTVIQLLQEGNRYEAPMGVGLIGPPGTGKTMIASAIAKEANLPFLRLGDIRDKFVGESEKNADRVLTLLRSLAPVVVFVDEIDQAFGTRGERGDSGVSQRIWAKFSEMQGNSAYRGQILWMWATNRPDIMDEATKRPGRLGDLKIPFFFAAQDPEAVIRRVAEKNHVPLRVPDMAPVLELVKGYSAAELEAVTLQSRWVARRNGHKNVTQNDLTAAAEDYIPARNDKVIEYMEILAILEASSKRLLPANYREGYDRNELVERAHYLRMELSARGLL